MRILIASIVAGSAALLASTASAQAQPQPQPKPAAAAATAAADPVVCEKEEVTGSRLATRKVCMKRSQWQDTRLQERQNIEKIQTQRGVSPTG